jgi:hypothetical protein
MITGTYPLSNSLSHYSHSLISKPIFFPNVLSGFEAEVGHLVLLENAERFVV